MLSLMLYHFFWCSHAILNFKKIGQKNKLGKIIILYDEDERLAPAAATTFVQREVDNVFMLSGGEKRQKSFGFQCYWFQITNRHFPKIAEDFPTTYGSC